MTTTTFDWDKMLCHCHAMCRACLTVGAGEHRAAAHIHYDLTPKPPTPQEEKQRRERPMTRQDKVMQEVQDLRRQASRRLDDLLRDSKTASTPPPASPSFRPPEQQRL